MRLKVTRCTFSGDGSAAVEAGLQYPRRKSSKHKRSHLHSQTLWEVSSTMRVCLDVRWVVYIFSVLLSDPCAVCAGSCYHMNVTWKAYYWMPCLSNNPSTSTIAATAKKMMTARDQPNAGCYQYLCTRLV